MTSHSAHSAEQHTGVTVLGTAQQAAWKNRTLPPVEQLPSGIWSVPVPIPDNPLRYTLSYLVVSDDGLVVVDPGWDADLTWEALTAGLAEAGASAADVTGVVITHVHPDHHGLSARLRAASGCWIAMHPAERDTLPQHLSTASPPADGKESVSVSRWLAQQGAPSDVVSNMGHSLDEQHHDDNAPTMAEPDVLLDDGDIVPLSGRTLRAVWTPGHTAGHLCLAEPDARVLLTGDHVLPRISPNIGGYPTGQGCALRDFLASLERIEAFDDYDVLPAHEYRFRGLADRARTLREHHEQRCAEIIAVVSELGETSAWEVATRLRWSRPWAEIGAMQLAAFAETSAHIDYLVRRQRLHRGDPDSGDRVWLRPATEQHVSPTVRSSA